MFKRIPKPGEKETAADGLSGTGPRNEQWESSTLVTRRMDELANIFGTNVAPVPEPLQSRMGFLTGEDLSDVKVKYRSPSAARFGTHAFTVGDTIHIGEGSERELSHELGHVVQQRRGEVAINSSIGGLPLNNDLSLERRATELGNQALNHPACVDFQKERSNPNITRETTNPVIQGAFRELATRLWIDENTGIEYKQIEVIYDYRTRVEGPEGDTFYIYWEDGHWIREPDHFQDNEEQLEHLIAFLNQKQLRCRFDDEVKQELMDRLSLRYGTARAAMANFNLELWSLEDELQSEGESSEREGEADSEIVLEHYEHKEAMSGSEEEDLSSSGERKLSDSSSSISSDDDDDFEKILGELAEIEVEIVPNRGRVEWINLGDYFANPKKYRRITIRSLQQGIALAYALALSGEDSDQVTALDWAREEVSIPDLKIRSGQGNLKVSYKEETRQFGVSGRPAFEKEAVELGGMKKGFHRRHILAWHTLKLAVQNVINQLIRLEGTENQGILQAAGILTRVCSLLDLYEEEEAQGSENETKRRKTTKPKLPVKPSENPDQLIILMEAILSKINSNILNLWPGDGYQNSLINTYQGLFRSWASEVDFLDNQALEAWRANKILELEQRSAKKKGPYARTLAPFIELLIKWHPNDGEQPFGIQFAEFLREEADTFEVDYPYSPDRVNFEADQFISTAILGMAGALLGWAQGGDAFNDRTAEELGHELENFLVDFMRPPDSMLIGGPKSSKSEKHEEEGKTQTTMEVEKTYTQTLLEDFVTVPNIGNSCYIAVVMNTVLTVQSYSQLFLDDSFENIPYNRFNLWYAGRQLLKAMHRGNGTVGLVTQFRTQLIRAGWLGGNLGLADSQQDAAELLNFLLEQFGNQELVGQEHNWQDVNTEEGSDIDGEEEALTGQDNDFSHVLNLTGLHAQGARSLDELLNENLDPTRVDNEQVDADTIRQHQWQITQLPDVLTIQLNRFRYSSFFGYLFKLNEKIRSARELTIPGNLTGDGPYTYLLSAFIIHIGDSPQAGHYISYQRRGEDWFCLNDSDTHRVSMEEIQAKIADAYMLTYEKT